MRIITLITDFGHSDAYVGIMKGVILSIAPHVVIVDLCHQVPPQDVRVHGSGSEGASQGSNGPRICRRVALRRPRR